MEPLLKELILMLLSLMGPGSILDAGANDGADSVMLADAAPRRQVVAVEPLRTNLDKVRLAVGGRSIRIVEGGLSNVSGSDTYPASADRPGKWPRGQIGSLVWYRKQDKDPNRVPFTLHTIDAIFENETLAFAHLDLEGGECNALKGANRTIWRDRPAFTVEAHPRSAYGAYKALVRHVDELDYDMYLVGEICGVSSCRNYVCLPRERSAAYIPALERVASATNKKFKRVAA